MATVAVSEYPFPEIRRHERAAIGCPNEYLEVSVCFGPQSHHQEVICDCEAEGWADKISDWLKAEIAAGRMSWKAL